MRWFRINSTDCYDWKLFPTFSIHDVHTEEEIVIEFFDNNGAPINESDLFEIIGQKSSCGCFYIELLLSGESHKSITHEASQNKNHNDETNLNILFLFISNCVIIW